MHAFQSFAPVVLHFRGPEARTLSAQHADGHLAFVGEHCLSFETHHRGRSVFAGRHCEPAVRQHALPMRFGIHCAPSPVPFNRRLCRALLRLPLRVCYRRPCPSSRSYSLMRSEQASALAEVLG